MNSWDLGALARAAEAEIRGGALPVSVEAVGIDSRSLPPASLFVAIRGERFDGHDFAAAAVAGGARAVLVDAAGDRALAGLAVPRLVVADTVRALGALARAMRQQLGRPLVAVTGSNGKTTTKELVAAVLARRGPVHKNLGNLNNHIGLPLSLLAWPQGAWAGVLEMGMSATGEIARLVEIGQPDVGIVTNVGPAHLGAFDGLEAVARAKGELFAGLPATATAIVNLDDPLVSTICAPLVGRRSRLTFGSGVGCDVRLEQAIVEPGGMRVRLILLGQALEARLPLVGRHFALNAAAAAAAATVLGIDRDAIATGLGEVVLPKGRFRLLTVAGRDLTVVDDTYNANPASMRAAFAALASASAGRRLAVLGDMLELGPTTTALHREIGQAAADSGIAVVLAFGEQAAAVADGARAGGATAYAFDRLEALLVELERQLRAGDWVLIKGSRGMRLERAVAHLTGETS